VEGLVSLTLRTYKHTTRPQCSQYLNCCHCSEALFRAIGEDMRLVEGSMTSNEANRGRHHNSTQTCFFEASEPLRYYPLHQPLAWHKHHQTRRTWQGCPIRFPCSGTFPWFSSPMITRGIEEVERGNNDRLCDVSGVFRTHAMTPAC
jgi:hypothetical protein